MDKKTEAFKMALEAMEKTTYTFLDTEGSHGLQEQETIEQVYKAITALRAALEEQPAEQEPVAWQRIETAPKTGKKVILFYLNRNNFPRTVMARWLTDDEAAETDTDCVGLEGGWYECIDNWDDYTEVAIHEGEPTHWMPLPPAPTAKGKPDVA